MAGFDAKAYKATVLRAYSTGEEAEQLREVLAELTRDPRSTAYARLDLNELFAVPTPVRAEELRSWRGSIASALNKAQSLPAGKMLKQLLEALEAQGLGLEDPAFWGGLQAKRQAYIQSALAEKITLLRAEYPLGVVTIEELIARLETVGIAGVTEGSIRKVALDHGLEVVAPIELPAGGVPAKIEKPWRAAAEHAAHRSILDVLLLHRPDDARDVTFIDTLTAPGGAIGVADIDEARAKSEQGRDSNALQSAQKLLVAIKNECRDDTSIAQLVLATVVDGVRKQLGRGKPKIAVRDHLVACGFDAHDSARIVAAVSAQPVAATSGPAVGLAQVRQSLSEGDLARAERTLTTISPDADEKADYAALLAEVERLKARKKAALDTYQEAIGNRDYSTALAAITEAIGIDQVDDTLPPRRDALPPAPPRSFSVRATASSVTASWAEEADESIAFVLVRASGHEPASPTDGDVVGSGLTSSSVTDASAPVATRLNYALFATRDGKLYSDPATASALVLPAPSNLRSTVDLTNAQLAWEAPAAATGAVVTRQNPDGSTIETEVSQGSTLRASGLETGAKYRFSVRAGYLLDGGRTLSEPVSITVTPRGEPSDVRDLQVAEDEDGLNASWSEIRGFEVELWSFPANASLPEGRRIDRKVVQQLGGVPTTIRPGATSSSARIAPFDGFARIAPLTVVDDGFLVGDSVIAGTAQPATEIVAEAFGDDLRISWKWPPADCVMEVAWNSGGTPRTRRVTSARYRAEGGVTIAGGATATGLSLATVVRFDGEETTFARTPVPWAGPSVANHASYSLRFRKSLLGRVTCEVVATSTETGFAIPARVVFTRRAAMPWDKNDGSALAEIDLDFTTENVSRHEVDIGKEKSPFWVCVFPLDESELTPPPTRELKG